MSDVNSWNQQIINEFRIRGGIVGNRQLLLLHTLGAKSGQPRINPVAYIKDGERFVIVAAKGGMANNPDWYHNLLAHPQVTVEVGTEKFPALATLATEPERTRLYDQMAAVTKGYAEYQRKTARIIPVILLTRSA
ncbi:MAG: nitroreductase family deazaflavin-dependent oxidoreductase [Chloroflexota bacterium]